MTAYYNEHDPKKAAWLRELIKAGHVAPGEVDERSIEDVLPSDLVEFRQCHFFAGIGVWSFALRLAGWSDERSCWTASCPCGPFSSAGKGLGFDDERHLFPAFHWLVCQCGPGVIFGEQVSSPDGLAWLDLVQADLEGSGFAFGALDLCAAGVGAPHIRQRSYWVAESDRQRREELDSLLLRGRPYEDRPQVTGCREVDRLADALRQSGERRAGSVLRTEAPFSRPRLENGHLPDGSSDGFEADRLADALRSGRAGEQDPSEPVGRGGAENGGTRDYRRPGPVNGFWGAADWLRCRDDKWRAVEPGTQPLVDGVAGRLGRRLHGYGDAIVAPLAAEFIASYMEIGASSISTNAQVPKSEVNGKELQ